MRDFSNRAVMFTLVVFAVALGAVAAWSKFWPFASEAKNFADFGKILVSFFTLIVIALFIERVVEVFTKGWRAPERERLEAKLENAKKSAIGGEARLATLAKEQRADQEAFVLAEDDNVKEASEALAAYRSTTRRYAFAGATVLGVLTAMLGVRALALFITVPALTKLEKGVTVAVPPSDQAIYFVWLDVFVTGLLLAGGAEGLHKIVDTFTTWMEETKKNLKAK